MFVQDLDRPWIDTPFLLQGFLIDDKEQLAQLVDCCEWVLVDTMRSVGVTFEPQYDAAPQRRANRPSFLPHSVHVTDYQDTKSVEDESPAAAGAFGRAAELLEKMAADIRNGGNLQVDTVEIVINDMVDSVIRNPDAMMLIARLRERDMGLYGHGLSVAVGLLAFGRHLGYPKEQLAQLGTLGMLLDIGKTKIPEQILRKNSRLTQEEYGLVKRHAMFSVVILKQTPKMHVDVLQGVAQHHERLDGSGYPLGLRGDTISVFGRMAAIADTFAALTRDRPHSAAVSPHEALQKLAGWGGTLFQMEMVEHFIQSIGVFPVGSIVELSTGVVAIVVTHNRYKRLKPRVLAVTDENKNPVEAPAMIDLLYDVSDNPTHIRRGLPSGAYDIDPREYYIA